ncbi:MAG: preprotein translocase subunit SecE [Ruminococcaceae bacterium]|nr:preprotein translocase subunit SecE [Oscillospiraceae bacterium]
MADQIKKESKIKKFFKDYKSEFKKIVWPEKGDTLKQSGIVIVSIIVVGAAIFLLDTGFAKLLEWLGKII